MVVGKHKTVWRYHNARAITREVNYCVLQGVLAIVELIISHLETFLLHNVVNSIRQVVDCPHTLVSMCGVESAECHHRSDKDCCFFLHYLFSCFYYDVIYSFSHTILSKSSPVPSFYIADEDVLGCLGISSPRLLLQWLE